MWRDRTNLYISYRQSYAHHPPKRKTRTSAFAGDDDRRGLLSPGADRDDLSDSGDAVIEMDMLPPRWIDISDEVNEMLATIHRKSTVLDRLHSKHVLPGFDDNRSAEEGEIERLTTDITSMFHKCQDRIRAIPELAGMGQAEENMARNIQVALAAKVQEASTTFRKKQSSYLKKLRGLSGLTTPLDFRSSSPAPYGSNMADTEMTSDVTFSQTALQQSATLTSNDAAIMQREREITDIAKGILELADIFKELQTMVIDQGTMLDRIDYNIEQLNVHVKAADREMTVAQGYQKKTIKRKIIMLLLLLVVGMIILVSIKPRNHGGKAPILPPQKAPETPNLAPEVTGPAPDPVTGTIRIRRKRAG